MFNGIVTQQWVIKSIIEEGTNKTFVVDCPLTDQLYIDQSIAHNGVCLTVTNIGDKDYTVTAIKETLDKTNLRYCRPGDILNIELAATMGSRIDGHFVQGHVDKTVTCFDIKEKDGSWLYNFKIEPSDRLLLVNRGSVCLNGISLTVASVEENTFQVAIIPFTYENTNLQYLKTGDEVNIEFDILGKYITQYLERLQLTTKTL
ncbi:MAG: riboflavin synthase [Saprospiraceae bacterium]|nr:riboflavin synthase [Saprospiraceae bacterium]